MDVDGVFQCYTLEPRMDRSLGKPYAISAGMYNVRLLESPHFDSLLRESAEMQKLFGMFGGRIITPYVENVPGFDAIEIHMGNYPRCTDGCTLVGQTRIADYVGQSDLAFRALMERLTPLGKLVIPRSGLAYYELAEPITISYKDAVAMPDIPV
jgi:hypothetical protein